MAILVGGDVMLGEGVDGCLPQVASSVRKIKAQFPGAKLVANLECPVCQSPVLVRAGFRADPARCKDILRLFECLSVANNHALDCGDEGLRDTVSFLRDLGVAVVGYRNVEGLQEGVILFISGTKVGVLGYVDEESLENKPSPRLATCSELNRVKDEIRLLRESADVVLCLLHAGNEMSSFPVKAEKVLPRMLSEYGADVVVRSHGHVVQGYERVRSSSRLIFYGLGDLVFDATVRRRTTSGIVYLSGVPLASTWTPLLFHRQKGFALKYLEGRSLPGLSVPFDGPCRVVDKTTYYVERAFSLLIEYGFGGVLYGIRRIRGIKNNRRMA